jgi:hypothetical protein
MNRRQFLTATMGTATAGVAGCLDDDSSGPNDSTPLDLGTAVVKDNVKVGVLGYTFIEQYATHEREIPRESQSFASAQYKTPPTPGAQFLLLFAFVEHNGSSRQYLPSGENDVEVFYGNESVKGFYPRYVFTNGDRDFASYYGAISHSNAKEKGAYPPFKAQGYMVYEVPKSFDPTKVQVEITWGWEEGRRGLTGGSASRWHLKPGSANQTVGEPPTSSSHDGQVQTRSGGYETETEDDGTVTPWDTITT